MATDYTSRDFDSVKADLIRRAQLTIPEWTASTQPDFAMLMVDLWAYMADIQNYYIDRAHTEGFLATATQRASVHSLARIMGYTPNPRTSATCSVTVANSSSASITVSAGTVFVVPETSSKDAVYFTSTTDTAVASAGSSAVAVKEGRSVSETLTTNFSGNGGESFVLSEQKVVPDSIAVTSGATTYSYVARLTDVSANTPSFTTVTDSMDNTRIVFGNGINGLVPTTGSTVSVTYRVGQGIKGNLSTNAITVWNTPVVGLSISSSTASTGGTNPEGITSIKNNAPAVRRSQDRAVTLNDYKNVIRGYSGVSKTHALTSTSSGAVTINYAALPSYSNYENLASGTTSLSLTADFGNAGTDINSNLAAYLTARSMVGVSVSQINTTVNLVDVYIDFGGLTVADGHYQATVKEAITAAIKAMFTWDAVEFDQVVNLGDLLTVANSVSGVTNATISHVGTSGGSNVGKYAITTTTSSNIYLPVIRAVSYSGVTGGIA